MFGWFLNNPKLHTHLSKLIRFSELQFIWFCPAKVFIEVTDVKFSTNYSVRFYPPNFVYKIATTVCTYLLISYWGYSRISQNIYLILFNLICHFTPTRVSAAATFGNFWQVTTTAMLNMFNWSVKRSVSRLWDQRMLNGVVHETEINRPIH